MNFYSRGIALLAFYPVLLSSLIRIQDGARLV